MAYLPYAMISSDEELNYLNLTPSDQSNCKSQTKLVSSQFNAVSAVEGDFDQPDGFSFAKNLVCSF